MDRKKNRSDIYQFLFTESLCSSEIMSIFSNDDSISYKLNPYQYNEEVMDLEDQLRKEFWRIVNNLLTPRQRDVIKLAAEGYTQMEIAKMLNVNQSSVTKSLNGNVDYKNSKPDKNGKTSHRSYGGSKRKLIKIIENDPKIKNILAKIAEIRDTKW